MTAPAILWFRQDLRLTDHPALRAACGSRQPLVACYVLDDESPGTWRPGSASRWWLHHSLQALAEDIALLGGRLVLLRGDTIDQLTDLAAGTGADSIYCTRMVEPWAARLEERLRQQGEAEGFTLRRYPGSLLFEPEDISNQSGQPFKVFTPFWKHCLRQPEPRSPHAAPADLAFSPGAPPGEDLGDWGLLPTNPDWASHWQELWQPGEAGARQRLDSFLADGVSDYREGRNHPSREATSRLSAHLHFGEISPRSVWHAVRQQLLSGEADEAETDCFLSEIGWREFSHHLLHHFNHLPERPFREQFEHFPWIGDRSHLLEWQRGRTGYPIVDAGMRELWHTGYMHNRVRMIVASFLTKHLLLPWQQGEGWFWDTLVDADLANNAAGWQWVAGSGADAAPYFRIFNPTLQGEKFDAAGAYVRRWIPELAGLPDRYLHRPSEAPAEVLSGAGVTLGVDYPAPIVDHRQARESALGAYREISGR
jgi:deoxyribodipyrimidine photo-lyase